MKSYKDIVPPPIYGLQVGPEFFVDTSLGFIRGRFTMSAIMVSSLIEAARHHPDDDKAFIQRLVTVICYLEPASFNYEPISLKQAQKLSDDELERICAAILSSTPDLKWLPRTDDNQIVRQEVKLPSKLKILAKSLRAWLGEDTKEGAVHLMTSSAATDVFNAFVRNANTSVTVADLARKAVEPPKLVSRMTYDAAPGHDLTGNDVSHIVVPERGPDFENLLAEARKATELQAKTAAMMSTLNDYIRTLSSQYTHDQNEARKAARAADIEAREAARAADIAAREKDQRDFLWVRRALYVTVFLGIVSIVIAIAALMNDYAGGEEAKAEAKQTREAIEAAGQAQSAALVRALQAIQDQQAGDAKLSRDQIQKLIDEARRPLPMVTPAAPARGAGAKPK